METWGQKLPSILVFSDTATPVAVDRRAGTLCFQTTLKLRGGNLGTFTTSKGWFYCRMCTAYRAQASAPSVLFSSRSAPSRQQTAATATATREDRRSAVRLFGSHLDRPTMARPNPGQHRRLGIAGSPLGINWKRSRLIVFLTFC